MVNNIRQHLHVSRGYAHQLRPVYTRSASVLCHYTLTCNARLCRRFEFARHFQSYLARPPFYMRMQTTTSDEHSIVTMLLSTSIIFSTNSLKSENLSYSTQPFAVMSSILCPHNYCKLYYYSLYYYSYPYYEWKDLYVSNRVSVYYSLLMTAAQGVLVANHNPS